MRTTKEDLTVIKKTTKTETWLFWLNEKLCFKMKQFEAKVQNSCFKKEIEYLSITNNK
jgi:hypothetical protein